MHISSQVYRLAELTRGRLDESAKMLSESFLKHNPVWKHYHPIEAQVLNLITEKTREMLDIQDELIQKGVISSFINFVYLDPNDRVVGVLTGYDLAYYLKNKKPSTTSLHHFSTIQKLGAKLEKSIDDGDKVIGKSIYSLFFGIAESIMSTGAAVFFLFDMMYYLKTNNINAAYARSSNIKSQALLVGVGGKITAKVDFTEDGEKYMLSFIRVGFPSLQILKEKISKLKAKI